MSNIIAIVGQTATGKTKLALELAKKYNGELVNFDSRQIYEYLDIITGKDISKNNIWLYDVVKPDQYFSSFDYVKKVTPIIKDIEKRGKVPILVGGTYLYLKHFLYGIGSENGPPDFKLREELNDKSVEQLQQMLKKLDPSIFQNLNHSDQLNPRRLIRKIEIFLTNSTTKISPKNEMITIQRSVELIGIKYTDKTKLRKIISDRVTERLNKGAINEVEKIIKMGYKKTDPGLKTIGYQQIIKYLNKELTKEEAIADWINKEVQYAKRQLTFMKKDKNIKWSEI